MAKQKSVYFTTPIGTLAFGYIAKADTEAPAGASFKPDGKFKGTLVLDGDTSMDELRDLCLQVLGEQFGASVPALEELNLPFKDGEGRKSGEFDGKILLNAASQFRPAIFDASGSEVPKGVFPRSGDTVRFEVSLFPFKKTEKVREGKKMVDVDLFGVSLRLVKVQIIQKGAGGGGGMAAVEGGYVASAADARSSNDDEGDEEAQQTERRKPANNGDF